MEHPKWAIILVSDSGQALTFLRARKILDESQGLEDLKPSWSLLDESQKLGVIYCANTMLGISFGAIYDNENSGHLGS